MTVIALIVTTSGGKMNLRFGMALAVMSAMAVGHVKAGEKEKIRSLVLP